MTTNKNKTVKYFLPPDQYAAILYKGWLDEKVEEARWVLDVRVRLTNMGKDWQKWDSYSYFANGGMPEDLSKLDDFELVDLLESKALPTRPVETEYEETYYTPNSEALKKLKKELEPKLSEEWTYSTNALDEYMMTELIKQGFTEEDARVLVIDSHLAVANIK